MSICPRCNKRNANDNKYCIYCGFNLEAYKDNKSFFRKEYARTSEIGSKLLYETVANRNDGIIVALLAKVAKADGRIVRAEANFISSILNQLQNPNHKDIREIYKKIIDNEKDREDNVFELTVKLNGTMTQSEKANLIEVLLECAFADANLHPKEEAILNKIVLALNFDYEKFKKMIKARHKETGSKLINSLDEAYATLKIPKSASKEEIKQAYRELVSKFHPDRLMSKSLDEDFIKFAEEKMKAINYSYDIIKKDRGIK